MTLCFVKLYNTHNCCEEIEFVAQICLQPIKQNMPSSVNNRLFLSLPFTFVAEDMIFHLFLNVPSVFPYLHRHRHTHRHSYMHTHMEMGYGIISVAIFESGVLM